MKCLFNGVTFHVFVISSAILVQICIYQMVARYESNKNFPHRRAMIIYHILINYLFISRSFGLDYSSMNNIVAHSHVQDINNSDRSLLIPIRSPPKTLSTPNTNELYLN